MEKKEYIQKGEYLQFIKKGHWEYIERINCSGVVIIIAVTNDNKLLLVEQYRIPVENRVIELPAGLAGDIKNKQHEKLEEAAERELIEETGYKAKKMSIITTGPPSAGLSSEMITFIQAQDLEKVSCGGGDHTESILLHEVPLSIIEKWLKEKTKQGMLIDPKIYTGLYFLGKVYVVPETT